MQEFARRLAHAFRALPTRDRVAQVWGDPLLRAGGSVGADYREAQRGRSVAEYRSKLGDCLRESDVEIEGFFKPTTIGPLKKEASELIAIFTTLLKT